MSQLGALLARLVHHDGSPAELRRAVSEIRELMPADHVLHAPGTPADA
jgi:hypothetical protein